MSNSNKPEKITKPTDEEIKQLTEAQEQISMKSQKHLEQWALQEAPYIIFKGVDLVRGLPWPDGHKTFQHLVLAYRSHRLAEPDDERPTRQHTDPVTKETVDVPSRKTDGLTIEELSELATFIPLLSRKLVEFVLQGEHDTARKNHNPERLKLIHQAKAVLESDLAPIADAAEELTKALQLLHGDLVAVADEISD